MDHISAIEFYKLFSSLCPGDLLIEERPHWWTNNVPNVIG